MERLFTQIEKIMTAGKPIIIAIDGRAASGKTTMAEKLTEYFADSYVFHMDEFFLRPEQRTPERFREIGGNIDYERFTEEVLEPLVMMKEGARTQLLYRPFSCRRQQLTEPKCVTAKSLYIIEGVYSLHESLRRYYDYCILLDVDARKQSERIKERDGEEKLQRYIKEWIPLEERYFKQLSKESLRNEL